MVDFYLDERTTNSREEMRATRRQLNEETYLPGLIEAIATCKKEGKGFNAALAYWLSTVKKRIPSDLRLLKLPQILQHALGLATQNVILEKDDSLWTAVDGGKVSLLFSPTSHS